MVRVISNFSPKVRENKDFFSIKARKVVFFPNMNEFYATVKFPQNIKMSGIFSIKLHQLFAKLFLYPIFLLVPEKSGIVKEFGCLV